VSKGPWRSRIAPERRIALGSSIRARAAECRSDKASCLYASTFSQGTVRHLGVYQPGVLRANRAALDSAERPYGRVFAHEVERRFLHIAGLRVAADRLRSAVLTVEETDDGRLRPVPRSIGLTSRPGRESARDENDGSKAARST